MEQPEFELLQVLAYFYLRNARPEKSAVLLDALSVLRPEDLKVRRSLALAQLRAGKPNKALETLDRLAMLGDTNANFHLMRSETLSALQRPDEAAASMRAYVSMRQVAATMSNA
ncbi:hypothetical protein RY831_16365 [Noviherbaspirillum sp. CPCC 100848]|uniref:Tetratricopeptide repeat protein n=1 Tax=Noviherbaspirillum album TaxID=3080276 RepID=A0ABU6JAR9_9BURK|nr:hypothetical protein [Noviherbaspirillum sp. CPCC 100848]MEC4720739.1 hypothetical protein [Noviherbaspirillum sp. CPCC 100848]